MAKPRQRDINVLGTMSVADISIRNNGTKPIITKECQVRPISTRTSQMLKTDRIKDCDAIPQGHRSPPPPASCHIGFKQRRDGIYAPEQVSTKYII